MAKKITAASIERALGVKAGRTDKIILGNDDKPVEVTVKRTLSIAERSSMIKDIASMVFLKDADGCEQYVPYLKHFAYDFNIVNYFTNITLPEDATKTWEFIDNTGIAILVSDKVGGCYIADIIRDANELIEYKKSELLKTSKLDTLLESIADVINALKKKIETLDVADISEFLQDHAPELKDELADLLKSIKAPKEALEKSAE